MNQSAIAFAVGMGAKAAVAAILNICWYLACLVALPDTFNAPTSTFPIWFFLGIVLIESLGAAVGAMTLVALAPKPAKLLVVISTIGLLIATFVLTQSGVIATLWIPVWAGHIVRIAECASFWFSARWLGVRLAQKAGRVSFGRHLAW